MEAVDHATWLIRRILKSRAEPIRHSTPELYIRATMGASQFPADGEDAERLLARAACGRELVPEIVLAPVGEPCRPSSPITFGVSTILERRLSSVAQWSLKPCELA
jgi:hypothetical protein